MTTTKSTTKSTAATEIADIPVDQAKVAAEATPINSGVIKDEKFDPNKDWSYLGDKDPDDSHVIKAALCTKYGPEGFEISAQQVQVFLAMHRWTQKHPANQNREGWHGRTHESVIKGFETLAERSQNAINGGDELMIDNRSLEFDRAVLKDLEFRKAAAELAGDEVTVEEIKAEIEVAKDKVEEAAKPATRKRAPRKTAAQKAESAAVVETEQVSSK